MVDVQLIVSNLTVVDWLLQIKKRGYAYKGITYHLLA